MNHIFTDMSGCEWPGRREMAGKARNGTDDGTRRGLYRLPRGSGHGKGEPTSDTSAIAQKNQQATRRKARKGPAGHISRGRTPTRSPPHRANEEANPGPQTPEETGEPRTAPRTPWTPGTRTRSPRKTGPDRRAQERGPRSERQGRRSRAISSRDSS